MDRARTIPLHAAEAESPAAVLDKLTDQVALHLLNKLRRHHEPTYDHSLRVGRLVRELADRMGWSPDDLRRLTRAGLLHDLGKVAVPRDILDKPAGLSEQEWSCMDRHSNVGGDMLDETRLLEDEAYIVRHHHRWYAANNPLGVYYDNRRDRAIDLLAVCDAYDAMISERPYSSSKDVNTALVQLEAGAGDQFCPHIVGAFRDMMHERSDELRF